MCTHSDARTHSATHPVTRAHPPGGEVYMPMPMFGHTRHRALFAFLYIFFFFPFAHGLGIVKVNRMMFVISCISISIRCVLDRCWHIAINRCSRSAPCTRVACTHRKCRGQLIARHTQSRRNAASVGWQMRCITNMDGIHNIDGVAMPKTNG